jgi:DNA repair protein RadC
VHPREVVKAALRHNAAAVVCDELITSRLKAALDIRLLDHLLC